MTAIRVHPPGPYPPHGPEPEGEIDLGIRLRDLMYTRRAIAGWGRRALSERLSAVARNPMRLAMASGWIDDLPATWPLASLIDDARERWTQGPDGDALAVLLRASHLLSPVLGWPTSIDRRWPMPDPDWVRDQLPDEAPIIWVPRAPADGTTGLSIVFESEVEAGSLSEPRVIPAGMDQIEADPEAFVRALEGRAEAIQVTTPGPSTEAQRDAWDRVRSIGRKQHCYDRAGLAGLAVEHVPRFGDLLKNAPPGEPGDRLIASCDVLFLPTLEDEGKVGLVGVVAWDAPFHPVRVVPGAAEVLRHLNGQAGVEDLARTFEVDTATVTEVLDQLVSLGAATAA